MKCPNCNNISSPKEVLRTWQAKKWIGEEEEKVPALQGHFGYQ